MSTQVQDAPTEQTTDEGKKPLHYVLKSDILASVIEGNFVRAICGEVFQVTTADKKGRPICQPCKEIMEELKKREQS